MNSQWNKRLVLALGLAAAAFFLAGGRVQWSLSQAAPVYNQGQAAVKVAPSPALADINSLSKAFTSLTDSVSPAVVNIYTKSGAPRAFHRGDMPPGLNNKCNSTLALCPLIFRK